MKKYSKYLLVLLPLLLVICASNIYVARGPNWMGPNFDPEYPYLLNALNIAHMKGPGIYQHPGIPVHVLGAVVMRTTYFLNPQDEHMEADVLKRPESYLERINDIMVFLNVVMLLLVGAVTYNITRSIGLSMLVQSSPFLSLTLLSYGLPRVSPEPLLLFASLAMICLTLLTTRTFAEHHPKTLLFLFALVSGFGVATKITFVPLLIIPLVMVTGIKRKLLFVGETIAAFVFFTLPMIRMYGLVYDWFYGLLTHVGHYGGGRSGIISSRRYLEHFMNLLQGNPLFSIVLIIAILVIGITFLVPKLPKESKGNIYFRLLVACTAAQVLGLVMVAKHTQNHYLLPVLALTGFMVFLLLQYGKYILHDFHFSPNYSVNGVTILLFLLLILTNPLKQFKNECRNLERMAEMGEKINRVLEKDYKDYVKIYYYRSSSSLHSLKFANDWARSYYSSTLEKLYGPVYFYNNTAGRQFSTWTDETSFEKIRARHGDRIIFQGSRNEKIPGLELKDVYPGKGAEGLFIVVPPTDPTGEGDQEKAQRF
ncbi:MAG: hypothetical protein GY765_27775 [bacterium]|nr:hypothetical protein [bacterium]